MRARFNVLSPALKGSVAFFGSNKKAKVSRSFFRKNEQVEKLKAVKSIHHDVLHSHGLHVVVRPLIFALLIGQIKDLYRH